MSQVGIAYVGIVGADKEGEYQLSSSSRCWEIVDANTFLYFLKKGINTIVVKQWGDARFS